MVDEAVRQVIEANERFVSLHLAGFSILILVLVLILTLLTRILHPIHLSICLVRKWRDFASSLRCKGT